MNTLKLFAGVVLLAIVVYGAYLVFDEGIPIPPADPGCLDGRWIAVTKTDACPEVDGWDEQRLFASDADPLPPPGLRPFCLYEQGERGEGKIADLFEKLPGENALQRDCVAVAPAAGALTKAMWPRLRDHFRSQAGRIPLTSASPPSVRLAFLDTAPTGNDPHLSPPGPGKSRHGYTLANLADDLLCRAGDCPVRLTAQLALPVDPLNPQSDEPGGFVGTLGDLATAIRAEVADWEKEGLEEHLVLNLSLAWDPEQFKGLDDPMPPRVQSVYRAVQDAVCRGALVVAAAGNVLGGPGEKPGPLLPAAWEKRQAPDDAKCEKLIRAGAPAADPKTLDSDSLYRPLLYAAGGVGSDGKELANARPDSMPRLVAYGDHAVTDSVGGPTATLTGSSVSTLVVSATAAAVWHHLPNLKSHQVMDIVYDSGDALGKPADFSLKNQRYERRRASLCRAMNQACAGPAGCPLSNCSWSLNPPDLSGIFSSFSSSHRPIKPGTVIAKTTPTECPNRSIFLPDASYRPSCPFKQKPGLAARPWVGPQPGILPCPSCPLSASTGVLLLEISDAFKGKKLKLTDPTLVIGSNSYSLPITGLSAGSKVITVTGIPAKLGDQVTLEFTVDKTRSTLSSVLVTK